MIVDVLNLIIYYLDKYSNMLLAIITGAYALLTYLVLRNTKNEHESIMRPYILIRNITREGMIEGLLIKNVGKTAAWAVKFNLDKDIFQYKKPERNIKEYDLFKNGTSCIPPEAEYYIDLSPYQDFFEKDKTIYSPPSKIEIRCEYWYKSISFRKKRKNVSELTIIDFQSSLNTTVLRNEIAEAIRNLGKK